jgi:UDP-GlcNAc3NAcA epimerase
MLKILTVIGARPQIIKAAALSRAIRTRFKDLISEQILHTGQHYDAGMSQVFFEELGIPQPDFNLNVGSDSHGKQTAKMIDGIETVLVKEKPGAVVLYGDTNSTLAGAIAASKLQIPVIHIEAGLRSFNKAMPEEINRIMCDHVSTLLFSPTKAGLNNLIKEGFKENKPPFSIDLPGIYHCGDVMYDNSLFFSEIAEYRTDIFSKYGVSKNSFMMVTIHRNNNTDVPERLNMLFKSINDLSIKYNLDVVMPLHPRTAKLLESNLNPELYGNIKLNTRFKIAEPASFMEMIALEKNCRIVLTDSGGVQKEAYYFQKPCVILRSETEWVELVKTGSAILADADEERIKSAFEKLYSRKGMEFPPLFGDGNAAEFICGEMVKHL